MGNARAIICNIFCMYSSAQLALKYMNYWIHASNGKGHGVHSPFVFELITNVFNNRASEPAFEQIEAIRTALLSSGEILQVEDFGAGSATGLRKQRTVQQIAATSLKKPKYARLLYRLVEYFSSGYSIGIGNIPRHYHIIPCKSTGKQICDNHGRIGCYCRSSPTEC